MLAAARIIPAIRDSGAGVLAESPEDIVVDEDDEARRILSVLGTFAPSILVAVYTSLLMQHFSAAGANGNGTTVDAEWWSVQAGALGGNLWRWINVACTMGVYAVELYLGRGGRRRRHGRSLEDGLIRWRMRSHFLSTYDLQRVEWLTLGNHRHLL